MAKKKVFSIGTALAQGLEETIESAQNYTGELRVDVIPLKKIELDPDNPRDLAINFNDAYNGLSTLDEDYVRKSTELESLQSIVHSIKTQGIINPVTVYKFGEKYRLIAGERRTLASILAGKTDIQAKILDSKPDELKISLLQWIENMERSDLSLWERLKNLEKIITAKTKNIASDNALTMTELSHLIGCSKPHAMHYLAVLQADDQIKKLIQDNKIRNLEKAALIAEIKSIDSRESAIQACLNGATLKQLKAFAEYDQPKTFTYQPVERRGRQTTQIALGTTKNINVVRAIIDALVAGLPSMQAEYQAIDWQNRRSVSDAFKRILKKLETIHA